jgi:hypothetical protein
VNLPQYHVSSCCRFERQDVYDVHQDHTVVYHCHLRANIVHSEYIQRQSVKRSSCCTPPVPRPSHIAPSFSIFLSCLRNTSSPLASTYTPNIPPPPPCLFCASPCIFSLTLTLTSKNFATQRSRHTDSPLLRSDSRYEVSMHFLEQDATNLWSGLSAHILWAKAGKGVVVGKSRRASDGGYMRFGIP